MHISKVNALNILKYIRISINSQENNNIQQIFCNNGREKPKLLILLYTLQSYENSFSCLAQKIYRQPSKNAISHTRQRFLAWDEGQALGTSKILHYRVTKLYKQVAKFNVLPSVRDNI